MIGDEFLMSEKTPMISVITPMYNAEKFLGTSIDSVLNQTFTDFELILIDDCSTDKTLDIAKSFSDSRIRILQTEKNLGNPGMARNIGLDAARGEYFYFVDADDAIMKSALETLLKIIIETKSDIVYCSKWFVPDDSNFTKLAGKMSANLQQTSNEPVSDDLMRRIWDELCMHGMHSVLWLCLYHRKVFNGENKIRFPNFLAEDVFVHFDILFAGHKITKIDKPFYFYRKNPDSLTQSKKNIAQTVDTIFAINQHIRKKLRTVNVEPLYIHNVTLSIINGITSVMLLPALRENPAKIFDEMENYLEEKFGVESENLATMFYNYLVSQNEWLKRMNMKDELQGILDKYKC